MQRFKLTLEYDGSGYVGWQRQENGPSVQEALEIALAQLQEYPAEVTGAGRTDAGVHALAQVAHLDLARAMDALKLCDALNFHLKEEAVSVLLVEPVPEGFHARFDARERRYLYRILNRRSPPALDAGRVWHIGRTLDAAAMARAAPRLEGQHDFTSFRSSQCQAKSPVKTLDRLEVDEVGEEIQVRARARSFLHRQVRNLVGSLVLVGQGRWSGQDLDEALRARNRAAAGPTAPPQGLYLTAVAYPENARLEPIHAAAAINLR